jgi:hypothetical protein
LKKYFFEIIPRKGYIKFNQPTIDVVDNFYNYDVTDLVKSNVETDFNRSGRIDAPRPKFATQRWLKSNEEFKLWMKNQEGAEFVRETPLTMLNHYKGN